MLDLKMELFYNGIKQHENEINIKTLFFCVVLPEHIVKKIYEGGFYVN